MKIAYAGGSNQNGCTISSWYDGSWNLYLDPVDPFLADQAAKFMEQICASNRFQCSLESRWSGYYSILRHQGNVELSSGNFDCSSLVLSAYLLAGLDIDVAGYTGNMEEILVGTGLFRSFRKKDLLNDPSHSHRGGIYVETSGFCVMTIEAGSNATAYSQDEINQAKADYASYQTAKKNRWKTALRQSVKLIKTGNIDYLKHTKDGIFDLSGNLKRDPLEQAIVHYGTNENGLEKIERNEPYLSYDQIPQTVINDFLGYEDRRFFSHRGYDLRGILRSLVNNLLGRSKQGASTITMQLAKVLFLTNYQRTFKHKAMQLYLAILMEHHFTKKEILELYINSLCFGNNCYGIEDAASFYFSKPSNQLTISECAFITAISQSPGYLNPLRYPDHTEFYRKNRLKYIHLGGFITDEVYTASLNEIPSLKLQRAPKKAPRVYDEIYTVIFDPKTLKFQDSVELVYQRLKQGGLAAPVIAGVLGNIQIESGFSADARSKNGSFGLLQWEGSRTENLKQAFPDTWNTLESQMDFFFMEADPDSPCADEPFVQFRKLCDKDSSNTPEYYSDLFQALIERNLSFDHRPTDSDQLLVSRKRFSSIPNAYDKRYYLDAPRRRNYARIYADCIALRKTDLK